MLGFDALGTGPLGDTQPGGSVPVRNGEQGNFSFVGSPTHTPSTDLSWESAPAGVTGTGAATIEITAEGAGVHTEPAGAEGSGAVTLAIDASGEGVHGVSGSGAFTIDITSGPADAAHGVAGEAAATLSISADGQGAHGVRGEGDATIGLAATGAGVHERYELRGEVRDNGVLVNRRVRAYLRSSGALIGEADTVAGRFFIHTGFAPAEHYIVPVHLDDAAEDWVPPVANRVVSVLALDA